MKSRLTKRQARYLDAIRRCDWTQRNKDGTPAMRKWARDTGMIEYATKAGQAPMWLTENGKAALANHLEKNQNDAKDGATMTIKLKTKYLQDHLSGTIRRIGGAWEGTITLPNQRTNYQTWIDAVCEDLNRRFGLGIRGELVSRVNNGKWSSVKFIITEVGG